MPLNEGLGSRLMECIRGLSRSSKEHSRKAADKTLDLAQKMTRRDFGMVLGGVLGTVICDYLLNDDRTNSITPVEIEPARVDACAPVVKECPETSTEIRCETILDKTLEKMIREMLDALKNRFDYSKEDLIQKKQEAERLAADIRQAFSMLARYKLQHCQDTPKEDIIDDDYFAAKIQEGPFASKVIIIRDYKYKNKAGALIQETVIDQPKEVKLAYTATVTAIDKGKGVNQDHQIILMPREGGRSVSATLLAVKKAVEIDNKQQEMVYAPPHNSNLHNPYLIAKGFYHFEDLMHDAWSRVRYLSKEGSMPHYQDFGNVIEESMVAAIMMTENVDASMLMQGANGPEMAEEYLKVLLTLGLNENNAFMMRHSKKTASGIMQVIRKTYKALHDMYGEQILKGDFLEDTLDHKRAAILAILHLYNQYEQVVNTRQIDIDVPKKLFRPKKYRDEGKCYNEEIFPAGYNSSMPSVINLIINNEPYPEKLKRETRPYLEKFRMAQICLDFLQTFFKEAISPDQVAGLNTDPIKLVAVKDCTKKKEKKPSRRPLKANKKRG